jgi:hypothetical protein
MTFLPQQNRTASGTPIGDYRWTIVSFVSPDRVPIHIFFFTTKKQNTGFRPFSVFVSFSTLPAGD